MNNEELKVRFEGTVSFDHADEVLLTVTDSSLIFKQKKGLINKEYKVVKEINIKDIKILKDVAMVEYENNKMTIHTKEEIFNFNCKTDEDANKIMNVIKDILGLGFMNKVEKVSGALEDGFDEVVHAAKGFVKEVSESEAVKEGTKAIKEAVTGFFDSFNKK